MHHQGFLLCHHSKSREVLHPNLVLLFKTRTQRVIHSAKDHQLSTPITDLFTIRAKRRTGETAALHQIPSQRSKSQPTQYVIFFSVSHSISLLFKHKHVWTLSPFSAHTFLYLHYIHFVLSHIVHICTLLWASHHTLAVICKCNTNWVAWKHFDRLGLLFIYDVCYCVH